MNRYFGSKCKEMKIRSCLSPDGQYILSGSEDGVPKLWGYAFGMEYDLNNLECSFKGCITDVDWNKFYNMIAFGGFGKEFPVLVYVHKRETNMLLKKEIKQRAKVKELEKSNEKVESLN